MLGSKLNLVNTIQRTVSVKMSSQAKEPTFFLGSGEKITKPEWLRRIAESPARVVCVGENHEDKSAHSLQLDILKVVRNQKEKTLALSLEFYDRESQTVMNEYVRGLIPLDTFLSDSRPPANHSDYQTLIDFCRDEGLDVISANCPRRYTRLVGRNGRSFLDKVAGTSAEQLLPPLPYSGPSEAYRNKFISIMEAMGNTNPSVPTSMLDAQALWDATMAHSIAEGLSRAGRILHITGYFHIQHRLGTVEHLEQYAPGIDVLTVVILPAEDMSGLNQEQVNIGDLIALTDIDAL